MLDRVIDELDYFRSDLIPPRYRIGGNGWTHCVLNYRRILDEGLGGYRKRVNAMPPSPLRRALSDTLAGITDFLRRAPGDIAACAEHPARDFRSAMRSFNFFFALDCYDSAGRFDDYMGEFYNGEPDAQMWLEELYRAVDLHDGWHFLHTAKHPAFTRLCLRAQKLRRPNSGLLAGPETPPEIWEELFDVWGRGVPVPPSTTKRPTGAASGTAPTRKVPTATASHSAAAPNSCSKGARTSARPRADSICSIS